MQTTAVKLRKTGWVTIRPLGGNALAAYVEGEREPAAWAHLSRAGIIVEVADDRPGIERVLVERLVADARAAGIADPRVSIGSATARNSAPALVPDLARA